MARGAFDAAEAALDQALDWGVRSREVELTLEAKLLELALADATSDATRAAQAHAHIMDAAVAGSFGAIRRLLEAQADG